MNVLRARHIFSALLTFTCVAHAQSPTLLQAVRLKRPEARALAATELEQCRKDHCHRLRALSLLTGYLTLSEGEAAEAVQLLASVPAPDALGPLHAFYLGQAYFYARRPLDAARQFEAALQTAPRWLLARLEARLGESLLAAGQPALALPRLEKATSTLRRVELYQQRADARRAVGNLDGERADLLTLAVRFPTHPYGIDAFEKLRAHKHKPLKLTFDERMSRANQFEEAGQAADALEELRQIEKGKLAKDANAQARVSLFTAGLLLSLGKEKEAQARLDQLIQKGPPAFAAQAALGRARRAMKKSDEEARAQMAKVAEQWPNEDAAEDALFFVGWLSHQLRKYPDAVAAFEAFDKRFPRSSRRDDVLWFRAMAHARMNNYGFARDAVELLLRQFPRSMLVPQAQYWSARWNQLQKVPADIVAKGYEQIIQTASGSLYAIFAMERLREMGRPLPPFFPVRPKLPEGPLPDALQLVSELTAAGLYRDAVDEISLRVGQARSSEQAVKLGAALQGMGEYGAAHQLGARFLWGQAYTSKDPAALALLYPRAFAAAVEPVAKERGVDPYFMWSIMRRESGFRTDVLSGADARGLMQLIPPTGIAVAKELGIPVPEPGDLFLPELNIQLAGWYVSALFKRFGHPVLAAAAYNAGPTAALKWVKDDGNLPLDLFVEEIPFRETRSYVKQVVADQHIYRALYAPDDPPLRLQLKIPKPATEGVSF